MWLDIEDLKKQLLSEKIKTISFEGDTVVIELEDPYENLYSFEAVKTPMWTNEHWIGYKGN